jgi:hypothetical protein
MEYHSNLTLGDKIEDCLSSARDTADFCREFQVALSRITATIREVEVLLRQKVDLFSDDPYEPVNRSHRIINDLLDELEDDVKTDRDTAVRKEGQAG